jgi:hypothetical protein
VIAIYLLDVPENVPAVELAETIEHIKIGKIGPYFEVSADREIVLDRRATGMRHAVWYSCIAGTAGCAITQWNSDALRAVPL